jgi:prevent-host-death family protein
MTDVVNVHEAKTHLSKLLARVQAGEHIVIAKAGKPIAQLVPVTERPKRRPIGIDKGLVLVGPDWDDPLPEFEEYM